MATREENLDTINHVMACGSALEIKALIVIIVQAGNAGRTDEQLEMIVQAYLAKVSGG